MTFQTFQMANVRYLALPQNDGVAILDELGNNFGLWQELSHFKTKRGNNDPMGNPIGKAYPVSRLGESPNYSYPNRTSEYDAP